MRNAVLLISLSFAIVLSGCVFTDPRFSDPEFEGYTYSGGKTLLTYGFICKDCNSPADCPESENYCEEKSLFDASAGRLTHEMQLFPAQSVKCKYYCTEEPIGEEPVAYEGNLCSNSRYSTKELGGTGLIALTTKSLWELQDAIDREGGSALQGISNLTCLEFFSMQADPSKEPPPVSDISALGNLTNLKALQLNNLNVSDITALSNMPKLESLDLSGTKVSDVSPLFGLKSLKTISLNKTNVSNENILRLKANLPQAEVYSNFTAKVRIFPKCSLDNIGIRYSDANSSSLTFTVSDESRVNKLEKTVSIQAPDGMVFFSELGGEPLYKQVAWIKEYAEAGKIVDFPELEVEACTPEGKCSGISCFLKYGIFKADKVENQTDPYVCFHIFWEQEFESNMCYNYFALKNEDASLCEKSGSFKDGCYGNLAEKIKSEELCQKIENENNRNLCISSVRAEQ